MAATNATRTPDWLEAAAKGELPASIDRVPLSAVGAESKAKPRIEVPPVEITPEPKPSESPSAIAAGFTLRALIPSTVVLAGITLAALIYLRPMIRPAFVLEAIGAPLGAVWAGQIVRGAYRRYGYSYRLADGSLTCRRGPLYPRDEPLELATVGGVEVRATIWEKLLGFGTVVVKPEESSGRPPIELAGVRDPGTLAKQLEDAASTARSANVKAVKRLFPGSR